MSLRLTCASAIGALGMLFVAGIASGGSGPAPKPVHGAVPWRAPANPLKLAVAAGLTPQRRESFVNHVHAHLDIFVNGRAVRVPAGIGINIHDPAVKVFMVPDGSKAYGGIRLCKAACISPLHTHDDSGVIHTESSSTAFNRLGQFFIEWGVTLTPTCVGGYCRLATTHVYVDGKPFSGDPRKIVLTDRKEIAIVIGTPPKKIPSKGDFSTA
jgi:hypothetical protein